MNNCCSASVDQLVNTVMITDDGSNGPDDPSDNTDTDTDDVDASPDMSIIKTADAAEVVPGQTYGYHLTVSNSGDQDATGVRITDTVPSGLTVDCASTSPAATTCDAATGELGWGPPLAPDGTSTDPWPAGDAATFTYEVTVDDPAAADAESFPNTAEVADDGTNGIDPTPANNASSAETTLSFGTDATRPDLSVVKDDGLATVTPGQAVTYTITVRNSGNIGATEVRATDTLPPGTTFVSCEVAAPATCAETPAGSGTVIARIPVLAGGGATATFSVTMRVDTPQPSQTESLRNVVVVTDDGTNGPEPTPEDNTDDDTDELVASPDLDVHKNDGVQDRQPGEQYTYTLRVRNKGNQAATHVVVIDRLPAGWNTCPAAGRGTAPTQPAS